MGLDEEFTDCKKALEFYEKLHKPEFLKQFEAVFRERKGQNHFNDERIEYHLKEYITLDHDRTKRTNEKFKMVIEEVRRMLLSLFYVIDCIKDGGTHNEKNAFTKTALHVLRKQINFFNEIREDQYFIEEYFNKQFYDDWRLTQLVTYDSLKLELNNKENEIKKLQAKIREYEDE